MKTSSWFLASLSERSEFEAFMRFVNLELLNILETEAGRVPLPSLFRALKKGTVSSSFSIE